MKKVVELQSTQNTQAIEAVDRITAALVLQQDKCGDRSFAFCGCSARSGVTTLSVEVAVALSLMGWKTLLINADLVKGQDDHAIGQVGLYEYFDREALLQNLILNTNWNYLQYISCGNCTKRSSVEALCSVKVKQLIEWVHDAYDFVIFDTPSYDTAADGKFLASKTDCTLLVAASQETEFVKLEKAKGDFEKAGIKLLGVVLTKVRDEK